MLQLYKVDVSALILRIQKNRRPGLDMNLMGVGAIKCGDLILIFSPQTLQFFGISGLELGHKAL